MNIFLSQGLYAFWLSVHRCSQTPESVFLSTDLSLLTSPNFLAPRLSKSSVHCESTGTGAPSLAEVGKDAGWNQTHPLVTTYESEPSSPCLLHPGAWPLKVDPGCLMKSIPTLPGFIMLLGGDWSLHGLIYWPVDFTHYYLCLPWVLSLSPAISYRSSC